MSGVTFYGSCLGLTVLAPYYLGSKSTNYYSPLTYQVHQKALNCQNGEERAVQLLHYFAKPADRVIQAVVAQIFEMYRVASLVKLTLKGLSSNDCGIRTVSVLGLAISPIIIPALLIGGIMQSIVYLLNGALQVAVPYQALYAVYKGKEAAKEYFEVRNKYEDDSIAQDLPKCFVWKNPPNVEKPDSLIDAYFDIRPLVNGKTAIELQNRLSDREYTAAQFLMNPGMSLYLIRIILMT